jgi:hypothetical protein
MDRHNNGQLLWGKLKQNTVRNLNQNYVWQLFNITDLIKYLKAQKQNLHISVRPEYLIVEEAVPFQLNETLGHYSLYEGGLNA